MASSCQNDANMLTGVKSARLTERVMLDSVGQSPSRLDTVWRTVFRHPLLLERESALFLIVSVLDVMMTYLLLGELSDEDGRTIFYESNPVARWFFEGWGVGGIVYFKFAMVAVVEVIAHVVAIRKVNVARRLLDFGTLLVATVVLYSMVLLLLHR